MTTVTIELGTCGKTEALSLHLAACTSVSDVETYENGDHQALGGRRGSLSHDR